MSLDLAAPYVVAVLFYALAPLLGRQVKSSICRAIESGSRHAGQVREEDIPYTLSAESIEDYIDYAVDAVQVFPGFLLPVVGAIYSFSTAVPAGVSLFLLLAAVIIAVGMSAWILGSSPPDYVSRQWHGYSLVPLIGMIFNIIALILVGIFS